MKHDRLVKEIEKLGLKVEKSTWHDSHYYAIGPVEKCDWFMQDGEAHCVQIMGKNQRNQMEIDYFPGFFAKTYKIVKEYLSKGMI